MANEEHLALIRQGIDVWNEWRGSNPEVKPDLSGANLSSADLSEANLERVNLSQANLKWVNLSQANLKWANLSQTNLKWANLSQTNLSQANFRWTDLSQANLNEANLRLVDLSQTNLGQATFVKADLRNADLSQADLTGADLTGASLSGANLTGTNLSQANLSEADLTSANLLKAQAFGTDFTQAVFMTANLKDWQVNGETKFDGTIYEEIALESNLVEPPVEDDSSETALTTIKLNFRNGIDWQAFVSSFQELQRMYGEQTIAIQALERNSEDVFVIRLTVAAEVNPTEVEHQSRDLYHTQLDALETVYCERLQTTREQLLEYRQQNTDLMVMIERQATQLIALELEPELKSAVDPEFAPNNALEPFPQGSHDHPERSHDHPESPRTITAALDAYIAPAISPEGL